MQLYSFEELDAIQVKLDAGEKRFRVGTKELNWSKTGDYFIQRNQKAKQVGLAYNPTVGDFVLNYPHIDNFTGEVSELPVLLGDPIVEPKSNGTNLGILSTKLGLIHRTRGSIAPTRFYNDINFGLRQGKTSIIGVSQDATEAFLTKYAPVFKRGRDRGLIDEAGNVVIEALVSTLKDQIAGIFDSKSTIGVFGELISPYNPIAVDGQLKYGIYLDMQEDFKWRVFDVLVKTDTGYSFVSHNTVKRMVAPTPVIEVVEGVPLAKLTTAGIFSLASIEEGVMVKGSSYYKLKREDVLGFERMIGKLGSIITLSVKRVLEKGLGYTQEDILERKSLLLQESFNELVEEVKSEIESMGITMADLSNYFVSTGSADGARAANTRISRDLQLGIIAMLIPILLSKGVDVSKLYLEVPKYVYFENQPLEWSERRQKYVPKDWYSRIIGFTYGLARKELH